ncbi:MAG TPA: M20/M25/M40 family metallo-hydrolase [Vicinamibacteria bacterium]|nr:M20/M25/M40 family metallo-hydrolase [Vicinamibacteria bacterium]
MTSGSPVHEALAHLDGNFEAFKKTLIDLSKIPSISASPFPKEAVQKSAAAIADALRAVGVENVQVLTLEGVHPYVYGDFLHKKGAPTLLLYGHHDVQPVGNESRWATPPFEPVEKGGRLYGRGTADDKGGVMTHVAAVACYLKTVGSLPCNVKFVIEGEEEIGSENLANFLKKYRKMLDADFIVLSDTANFDTGVPALTYQLRGIVQVDVEVETLKQPRHSGMWGGPIPDPVQVLSRMIADLTAADGKLNVPGLYNKVAKTGTKQLARIRKLPFREAQFKKEAGTLTGVRLSGEARYSVYERLWTRPSLTVIAMESHPIKGSSNQIVNAARARLSLRTVPNMDGPDAGRLLVKRLTKNPPYGAKVTAKVTGSTPWWTTDPEGPAFEAARRALKAGYGKETVMMGAGGSIGFVGPFEKTLGGVPCLLMGVEDPYCNAHSENESLDLADFKKSIRSAIFLYDELSRVPTK